MRQDWHSIADPVEPGLVQTLLDWAWAQSELQEAIRQSFRIDSQANTESVHQQFVDIVFAWIKGDRSVAISAQSRVGIDDLLGVHTHAVTYALQTLVEQGLALLEKAAESRGSPVSAALLEFPDHLRYGVPTTAGRLLAANGVRHRLAYVLLGQEAHARELQSQASLRELIQFAERSLVEYADSWRAALGHVVYTNTLVDLQTRLGL